MSTLRKANNHKNRGIKGVIIEKNTLTEILTVREEYIYRSFELTVNRYKDLFYRKRNDH